MKKSIQRALWFLSYHNGAVIALAVLLLAGSALAATGELGVKPEGEPEKELARSVPPLMVDVSEHDFGIRVTDTQETAEGYLITYTYESYGLEEGEWQITTKTDSFSVALSDFETVSELRSYVATQLEEIVSRERGFLARMAERNIPSGNRFSDLGLVGLTVGEDGFVSAAKQVFKRYANSPDPSIGKTRDEMGSIIADDDQEELEARPAGKENKQQESSNEEGSSREPTSEEPAPEPSTEESSTDEPTPESELLNQTSDEDGSGQATEENAEPAPAEPTTEEALAPAA